MKSAVGILALVASVSLFVVTPVASARPGGFASHSSGFGHGGGAHFSAHGAYGGAYHGGWGRRGWGGGVYIDPWWGVAAYPYAYSYYGYPGAVAYDAPVYSQPVAPQAYVQQSTPANPPPAAQGDWFYCQSPAGYYPYVKNCAQGWQRVPAQPPGAQ